METEEREVREKVEHIIKMIDDMDIKDKLRLAIRITETEFIHLIYDKEKENKNYDSMLREIDEKYRKSYSTFREYFNVGFTVAKIMETPKEGQNRIALYLFNSIRKVLP